MCSLLKPRLTEARSLVCKGAHGSWAGSQELQPVLG